MNGCLTRNAMVTALERKVTPVSSYALTLSEFMATGPHKPLANFVLGGLTGEVHQDSESVWIIFRRGASGGLALAHCSRSANSNAP